MAQVEGVTVYIHGLGVFNGMAKRVLRAILRKHIKEYLERECRDLISQELRNAAAEDGGYFGKGII